MRSHRTPTRRNRPRTNRRHPVRKLPVFLGLLIAAVSASGHEQAVNHSSIAFTLTEKDLLPESIAYDPRNQAFYVGSTRKGKILRIHSDGKVEDFVPARAFGLWMVIGIKVDPKRNLLWVNSSYGGNLEQKDHFQVNDSQGNDFRGQPAGLFKFNLDNGKLEGKYLLDNAGSVHFLNDLVIAANGDVYLTHMFEHGKIYRLEAETDTFAPFFYGDSEFTNPNGITFGPDGDHLYVAHREGVSRINIHSRERQLLQPGGLPLTGIDGLYYHTDALIAVHAWDHHVVRHRLDRAGLAVTEAEYQEAHHPLFNNPTTGVLVDNAFYYIANAQFDSFDDSGRLWPMHRLYQPVILKLEL